MNQVQRPLQYEAAITKAVNDLSGRTVRLREVIAAGVAFLVPLAIGLAALTNAM